MCKMLEEMRNEAVEKATIPITIKAYRAIGMSEQEIKEWIISNFNLSEVEALEYMQKKSA